MASAGAKITSKTVEAAVKDAVGGKQYDVTDPQCPGLQLRVRGGAVSWAVRARLHGKGAGLSAVRISSRTPPVTAPAR
jgi:hypothetical protein